MFIQRTQTFFVTVVIQCNNSNYDVSFLNSTFSSIRLCPKFKPIVLIWLWRYIHFVSHSPKKTYTRNFVKLINHLTSCAASFNFYFDTYKRVITNVSLLTAVEYKYLSNKKYRCEIKGLMVAVSCRTTADVGWEASDDVNGLVYSFLSRKRHLVSNCFHSV